MLYRQTVRPELLELLEKLMSEPLFNEFNLVGGTSLALQIGHRNSIDIDLFGQTEIPQEDILNYFNDLEKVIVHNKSKAIIQLSIDNMKVDFVKYNYPLLKPVREIDGIRFVSKEDIAAMKLNAIAGRGSKKDFIDLFFLLDYFSLDEMITFYQQKYHDGNQFIVLKSLNYFADADTQADPIMLNDFSWEEAKKKINTEVEELY